MTPEVTDPRESSDATGAIALIGLGYLYIVFVMAALGLAGVLIVRAAPGLLSLVIQLGIVYLLLLLEAIWVRVPKPSGRKLSRSSSPKLIDEVEAVAGRLDAPLPNSVLVTADFNAAAAERPRFGIFGAPKRYLLLGLPLFDTLSSEELRAVIGHELAHLSYRHGRLHLLVARVATSWRMLAVHVASRRRYVSWLFLPFFRWYIPKLQTASDSLSRGHERESDELSAEVGTPLVAGLALLRISVQTRRLRRVFFPSMLRESARVDRAPSDVMSAMEDFLRTPPSAEALQADVGASLNEQTAEDATHPALRERLTAMGVSMDVESLAAALVHGRPETVVASGLLGRQRALELRADLSTDMVAPFARKWRELRSLVAIWRLPDGSVRPGPEANIAYARWASEALPASEAIPLLRESVNLARKDRELALRLGSLLLDEEQEATTKEAIPILERVAASDSSLALVASGLLRQAYLRLGKENEIARLRSRESDLSDAHLDAVRERSTLKADDDLEPATIPPEALRRLVGFLRSRRDVHRAFLVLKRTQYLSELPFIVLVLQRKVPWYKPQSGKAAGELLKGVLAVMDVGPAAHGLVTLVEPRTRLLRRLRSIPKAVVFDRAPNESFRPLKQLPKSRILKILPSGRLLVFASILVFLVLMSSRSRSGSRRRYEKVFTAEETPSTAGDNISPEADIFGRNFIHLLQVRQIDSVAGLLTVTPPNADPMTWARKLVAEVPDEDGSIVERTLGLASQHGAVTRDLLSYTVSAPDRSVTVVIETVERQGVRSVEHARVCGVPSIIVRWYRAALKFAGRAERC